LILSGPMFYSVYLLLSVQQCWSSTVSC